MLVGGDCTTGAKDKLKQSLPIMATMLDQEQRGSPVKTRRIPVNGAGADGLAGGEPTRNGDARMR